MKKTTAILLCTFALLITLSVDRAAAANIASVGVQASADIAGIVSSGFAQIGTIEDRMSGDSRPPRNESEDARERPVMAELKAYPGFKYNEAFSIIADRVARINRGYIAGSAVAISDEMIQQMTAMYISMDIDGIVDATRKAGSPMDEAAIENMRKMQKMAREGTLGDYFRGIGTSEGADEPEEDVVSGDSNAMGYKYDQLRPSEAMEGYNPDDEKAAAEWALSVAGDMVSATIFDCVTPGLMNTAGLAVSVYAHTLVLNNYAGLLGEQSPMDALFFYFAALEFEPRNPLILINIGMTYLDMEFYDAAKEFALMALEVNPECGQAYQILTMCHLKDGNSVLAAETLFKSTRDYFDELTIGMFDSYFEAVNELKYEGDTQSNFPEFPITDDIMDLLYEMARKYVDTAEVNESVDSPAMQLTVKSYPSFGDGEDIMNSMEDYERDLKSDHSDRERKLDDQLRELERKIFDQKGKPEELKIMHNMRQYYAYLTLEKYYNFQQRKKYFEWHYKYYDEEKNNHYLFDEDVSKEFDKQVSDTWHASCARETAIINEMEDRIKQMEEQRDKECAEWMKRIEDEMKRLGIWLMNAELLEERRSLDRHYQDLTDRIKEAKMRYMIRFYKQCQSDIGLIFDLCKRYAIRLTDMDEAWYNENKQLMEEFWLKAGGILKYITDPEMLWLCEMLRERFVVRSVSIMTYRHHSEKPLLSAGDFDDYYNGCIGGIGWHVYGKYTVQLYYNSYNMYQEKIDELEQQLSEFYSSHPRLQPPTPVPFGGSPVEIEGGAIQEYKDPYAQPMQGFTVGGYYFRYNSDGYSWSLPFDDRGKHEYAGDRTTIYERDRRLDDFEPVERKEKPLSLRAASAYDATAKMINASEMPDKISEFAKKIMQKEIVLDNPSGPMGNIGAAKKIFGMFGDVMGYIGFAQAAADVRTSGSITYSKYVTRDSRGRVLDQGNVYERQVGGSIMGYGLERTTTVTKSKITGVATKKKSLTHKYKYGTMTY